MQICPMAMPDRRDLLQLRRQKLRGSTIWTMLRLGGSRCLEKNRTRPRQNSVVESSIAIEGTRYRLKPVEAQRRHGAGTCMRRE